MKEPKIKMSLRKSLVVKLTVLITLSILIIWLLVVFSVTCMLLARDRQSIIKDLNSVATLRATLSNYRFEGAEHDAELLMHTYTSVYFNLPLLIPGRKNDSRYFPFNAKDDGTYYNVCRDRSFLQLYGTAGLTYYQDSFILNRDHGIILLPPRNPPPGYFPCRLGILKNFPDKPVHDNFYWTKPEFLEGDGWSVSVATSYQTGILGGVSVRVNDLIASGTPHSGDDITLWLDRHNQVLPFSGGTEKITHLLKGRELQEGWQEIPGYLVLRTTLNGPGWQQILMYPIGDPFSHAFNIIKRRLPYALVALFIMASICGLLLHYYLARPLWRMVDIINRTGPESLDKLLPEKRQDEFGHISRAYNRLLTTLRAQYDNMENTVAERTNELNKAKQNAELASKRKSTQLTTISHELRTPLCGVLGAVELLQNTPLNTTQEGLAQTARQCTLSLLTIINDLLDFSRIESGHFSLHIEDTALLPLLDQAMQTIQGPAHHKHLTLRTFVDSNVPLRLETDGIRLRQILVNLLGNAQKFTDKGTISLTVRCRDDKLVFTVKDSGKGIEAQYQKEIFTPFFQAQSNCQGTGLGLTISSNLARIMGGTLELNSTVGRGTSVSFILPLNHYEIPVLLTGKIQAPAALHRQLNAWGLECEPTDDKKVLSDRELCFLPDKLRRLVEQLVRGGTRDRCQTVAIQPWRLKVLLVDDAAINRDIIGNMLQTLGQDIVVAENAESALAKAVHTRFDLVLMDIRMPGIDGIECVRLWRELPDNRDPDCMIVALSANAATEEIQRCTDAGFNNYLTKPVMLTTLANIISDAAECQLRRNIPLHEQDPWYSQPVLTTERTTTKNHIYHEFCAMLQELEQAVEQKKNADDLLHKLKGCSGQAGFSELFITVEALEQKIQSRTEITKEDLCKLRKIMLSYFNHNH